MSDLASKCRDNEKERMVECWTLNYGPGKFIKCDPVIPMGDFPSFDSPHNWFEDITEKDGNYWLRCVHCEKTFVGNKDRTVCKICGTPEINYKQELDDLQSLFDMRWATDMRAIKRWQEATGRDRTWPDATDLTVWLLEQLDELEDELYGLNGAK